MRATDQELLEYLSTGWREYVSDRGPASTLPLTVQDGLPDPHGFMRAGHVASDWQPHVLGFRYHASSVVDRADVRRAILTFGDYSHVGGHHNPYFATELARSLNDWSMACWLCADTRPNSDICTRNVIGVGGETTTSYLPAMRLMAADLARMPFDRIVTQRLSLECAQEGVELAQTDAAMKIVMAPNGMAYA